MAHSIHIEKLIILPNRQRRDFDPEALTDLANSIAAKGLMHPIVCRETPDGVTLVAGERRLRALEQLWLMGDAIRHNEAQFDPYHVPYVTLGELDPLEAEEAELDENIKRRDLTWQEKSEALSRLHALRTKQAELAGASHTIADTLEEANVPKGSYSAERQTLLLAPHLHKPEVAAAKTPAEAFKIVKREEERERSRALAEQVGATYSSAAHKLHHVDCLDWLRDCDDNQFDVVLTDPPYGMNAQGFGDAAGKLSGTDHRYDDSPEAWRELMSKFLPEAYRVAKKQAHLYVCCDFDRFHELKLIAEKAGWHVFRTPFIIYKLGSGRVPLPEHGPRRQYELCLYANKGNKPVTGIYSDVIPCKLEENFAHGANKPVELYVDLLRRSVRPGDSVIDPFAGTGTIFPAAHSLKLYATGLEISSEYYGIAVKRLNALDTEPAMI